MAIYTKRKFSKHRDQQLKYKQLNFIEKYTLCFVSVLGYSSHSRIFNSYWHVSSCSMHHIYICICVMCIFINRDRPIFFRKVVILSIGMLCKCHHDHLQWEMNKGLNLFLFTTIWMSLNIIEKKTTKTHKNSFENSKMYMYMYISWMQPPENITA